MLSWLKRRAERRETAAEIYGAVVARAREPAFYAAWGVPDTPEGRYEMIVLHLVPVLERLRALGPDGVEPARRLIETFITDMDDSMREMGVGDLTVPKKVKGAAAGLYARAEAFRAALAPDACEGALEDAIGRLTLAAAASDPRAPAFARYYRGLAVAVAQLDGDAVLAGRVVFPALSDGGRAGADRGAAS